MVRRSKFPALAAALLWLLLCIPTVSAAENGSLEVKGVTETVELYQLLDQNGNPAGSFTGAGELLQEVRTSPVTAARKLADYAGAQNWVPAETTPDQTGSVNYENLPLGMYLVCSTGGDFAPFLLEIPTVINGKTVYQIEAKPKLEEPPAETVPPTSQPAPSGNPDPAIPQTGVSVIPKYALMCLGTAITLWGLLEMLRGREDMP